MGALIAPPTEGRRERLRLALNELRATLPENCASPTDARALAVYSRARDRYFDAWAEEVLMQVFTDLKPLETAEDKYERGLLGPEQTLDEIGRRMKDLHDYVAQHVAPLVPRLEAGLAKMAATPFSPEGDAEWLALADYWRKLRRRVSDALPSAYQHAIAVRALYLRLDKDLQEEAERRYGPLRDPTRDQYNAWTLMKWVWPGERLARLDQIARTEGIWVPGERPPWMTKPDGSPKGPKRKKPSPAPVAGTT